MLRRKEKKGMEGTVRNRERCYNRMGWDLKAIQEWERVERNKVEKGLWRREKDI